MFRKIKSKIKEKLNSNEFTASVVSDYDYRTVVFAVLSFVITVAFATINLVSAIRYRLIWYGAIAAYYFVLVFFRGMVLLANKRCAKRYADNADGYEKSKWKIYLASGAFLILLEFAMVAAVTQMMLSERPVQSGQIMAIANATYTFYKITVAIYNLVKAHKLSNPVTQSLRNLNFADACMSIVTLTVLMISTFEGEEGSLSMLFVKSATGFFVCAGIIALATVMIIQACKKLKAFKEETENE